ncbi:MAG TPA: alginate export family protein, partial [Bryobacteraceae bacterium]|nr:alginate export family protein [Bryobacteraceae bacterium]
MLRIAVLLMLRASGADSGAALQPTEVLNGELPRWMRFSGEYRSRFEDQEHMLWRPGNSDRYLLSRLRLGLAIQPAPWLVFFGQAQDSRIFIARRSPNQPPYQDSLDLRQAYAQLGDGVKFPLQLRVGRQEFSYGEERLVGLSNWHNIGRSFNAVKLTVTAKKFGGLKMDVFAASVVATREARWDTSVPGDNLHGAYALFDKLWSGGTVEPYFYWRLSPSVATETGGQAKMNTGSLGLRLTRKLTPKWYASS